MIKRLFIQGITAMSYLLLFVFGLLLLVILVLASISTGKPAALYGEHGEALNGSISEKIFVPIGGIEQGMIIRSRNVQNPVLLFLHGGPAFPTYFLIEKYNPGLEEYFTVCYWEQRGGGISFTPEVDRTDMTLEQLTSDAMEVTLYLRERFRKEKIYILGHSGGTTIAMPAVAKAPHLYQAYIAMAQITRQSQSERIAYDFMVKECTESKDYTKVKALKKFRGLESDTDLEAFYNSAIRDKAMHALGIGTMKNMQSILTGVFIPSLTCKAYTLKEKYNTWKSKFFFLPKTRLRHETLWADFATTYPEVDIPVYFICGRYDLTVNKDLTYEYFNKLNAPVKRFYEFEHSAHSPLLEEPGRFKEILKNEILVTQ